MAGVSIKVSLAAVLAALLLSACRPATAPDDDKVLLPARGGIVQGGAAKAVRLGPFSGLNDDCSVQSYAAVRILQQPRNGTLAVVRSSGVATFAANNAFARCNGAPIRGTFVNYTPRAGYEGPETFRIEVIFADGERRLLTPVFTVSRD
jgi:hypothetical protein